MSVTASSLVDQYALQSTTSNKNRKNLGQEDFLELMMTQLKNQDPFKPMENGEFLGQMAQFSSVNGITELKNSFADLSEALMGNQTLQATNLIGKSVLTTGNEVALKSGGTVTAAVTLPASSGATSVGIYDMQGRLVRKLELGPHAAGTQAFSWDGRTSNGTVAPAGTYQFAAEVKELNGGTVQAETLIGSKIISVDLTGGKLRVNTDDGRALGLTAVRQIQS
ncbi:MAG: flagellar hook assembly protein FlgD [Thiotrichales bacterium]